MGYRSIVHYNFKRFNKELSTSKFVLFNLSIFAT